MVPLSFLSYCASLLRFGTISFRDFIISMEEAIYEYRFQLHPLRIIPNRRTKLSLRG
jgi:hypothetical protein